MTYGVEALPLLREQVEDCPATTAKLLLTDDFCELNSKKPYLCISYVKLYLTTEELIVARKKIFRSISPGFICSRVHKFKDVTVERSPNLDDVLVIVADNKRYLYQVHFDSNIHCWLDTFERASIRSSQPEEVTDEDCATNVCARRHNFNGQKTPISRADCQCSTSSAHSSAISCSRELSSHLAAHLATLTSSDEYATATSELDTQASNIQTLQDTAAVCNKEQTPNKSASMSPESLASVEDTTPIILTRSVPTTKREIRSALGYKGTSTPPKRNLVARLFRRRRTTSSTSDVDNLSRTETESTETPRLLKKKLHQMDPKLVASQLVLIDSEMLRKIKLEELKGGAWVGKNKETRAPNILKMVQAFNRLALLVPTEILEEKTPSARAKVIAAYIQIADKCRSVGNYNSLKAILAGLQCTPIYRLKKTWKEVSGRRKKKFEDLSRLMSEDSNWKTYKIELKEVTSSKKHCVPFLGQFLTQILQQETVNDLKFQRRKSQDRRPQPAELSSHDTLSAAPASPVNSFHEDQLEPVASPNTMIPAANCEHKKSSSSLKKRWSRFKRTFAQSQVEDSSSTSCSDTVPQKRDNKLHIYDMDNVDVHMMLQQMQFASLSYMNSFECRQEVKNFIEGLHYNSEDENYHNSLEVEPNNQPLN